MLTKYQTKQTDNFLKRKVGELPFLTCRLSAVESALRFRAVQKRALPEANTFFLEAGKPGSEVKMAVEKNE